MKIFGINFTTKKELKQEIARLKLDVESATKVNRNLVEYNDGLARELGKMKGMFPFIIGQVVYDIQLRSETGRYTRTKASREHSIINEVVVDEKNYFKLVNRLGSDVFTSYKAAEEYLDEICIK